jgi:chemotaxis protein CheZ
MNAAIPGPLDEAQDVHDADDLMRQLGSLTRRLQFALGQLDAMPRLQQSAQRLPAARGRLGDVADKAGEAADKVLSAVERAKHERARIAAAAARLRQAPADRGSVVALAAEVEASAASIDAQLTDIMVAQAFHDLSGQLLCKVAAVMTELEDGLLQLLGDAAPLLDMPAAAEPSCSQSEADELLASHGR